MTYGLVENMRTQFQRQLRPLKGGASGVATIQRANKGGQRGTWTTDAATVAVHYEQRRTDGGSELEAMPAGVPGYTVYVDGRLATPLKHGDRFIVNGMTLMVEQVDEVGNLTRNQSYTCAVAA